MAHTIHNPWIVLTDDGHIDTFARQVPGGMLIATGYGVCFVPGNPSDLKAWIKANTMKEDDDDERGRDW